MVLMWWAALCHLSRHFALVLVYVCGVGTVSILSSFALPTLACTDIFDAGDGIQMLCLCLHDLAPVIFCLGISVPSRPPCKQHGMDVCGVAEQERGSPTVPCYYGTNKLHQAVRRGGSSGTQNPCSWSRAVGRRQPNSLMTNLVHSLSQWVPAT